MTVAIEMTIPERRRDKIAEGATRVFPHRTPKGEIRELVHGRTYAVEEALAHELTAIGYARYVRSRGAVPEYDDDLTG
jgi:hypothetical protein